MKILGSMLLLLAVYGVAGAAIPAPTPEIDAQSGVSALMFLSGAVLVIRGRRR